MIRFLLLVFLPLGLQAQFTYVLDQDILVEAANKPTLNMPWGGGLNAPHYNTMDLNGDGNDDLVLFDRTADKVITFLNDGGRYVPHPEFETFFPDDITNWLLLRDFNCDGKKDIFTGHILGIKVYTNTTGPGENLSWEHFLFFSGFEGDKSPVLLTKGFSSKINLQLQFDDLPAVIDADGDGDLDIFNVRFVGNGTLEYHQNFSMERYGTCDSLDFERMTQKWGDFTECGCGTFAFNGDDCPAGGRIKHAGGKSLLVMDVDGDTKLDILLSEASCYNLYLLKNEGTLTNPVITTASIFPAINSVNFSIYPAAFYEDLNFDGKKDLLAIPNIFSRTLFSTNLAQSNWLYTNSGTTLTPSFTFTKGNFLQDQMIDVGDNAVPAFLDYDADGDYDLFVSQFTSVEYTSRISVFENIGTADAPAFKLVDNDFLNFSQYAFYNLKIQFTDINKDSKIDMVFTVTGLDSGQPRLYYMLNKGSGIADFADQPIETIPFTLGSSENVLVTDVDKDGLPDLLVGRSNGSLSYWKDNGPAGSFNFALEDESFLGLSATVLRQNIACTVADFDMDGQIDLAYGDQSGRIKIVPNFREVTDASGEISAITLNPLTNSYESRNLGGRIWPTSVNLFNTTRPALVVGNVLGGLHILRHDLGESLPAEPNIEIYPNPVKKDATMNISIDRPAHVEIYSMLGHRVTATSFIAANQEFIYPLPPLSAGVYVLRFTVNTKSFSKRIVIY